MSGTARMGAVIVDCADPAALAEFYGEVTGWKTTYEDDDFVYLGDGDAVQLGFQRIADYQGPGWPDPRKHFHLELVVADIESAAKQMLAQGAAQPDFQPAAGDYLVLTDPEGHPFCVTTAD
jgi:predicted enzyme related to lactoylglutathione lyase